MIKLGCSLIAALGLLAASANAQPAADATSPAAAAAPAATAAPAPAPEASATPAPAAAPVAAAPSPDTSAAPPPAPPESVAAPPPNESAQAPVAGSIPPPPAGKGQVVFFRSSSMMGMAIWFNIRENGVALGKLTNGAYFVQVTDPGPHTYTAATENHNVLHLEVDDGETYYVRGTVQMGVLIGEANMAPSDQATFEKALKHMHLAKPEPATGAVASK